MQHVAQGTFGMYVTRGYENDGCTQFTKVCNDRSLYGVVGFGARKDCCERSAQEMVSTMVMLLPVLLSVLVSTQTDEPFIHGCSKE